MTVTHSSGSLYGAHRRGGAGVVSPFGSADLLSADEDGRSGRHLSRHESARSLPLARRRQLAGHSGLGRGAEQGHLPVSREDPVSETADGTRHRAQQLREILRAVAQGAVLLLQKERRSPESERSLHPEGGGRQARGAHRSQRLVGRRDDTARRVRAVTGRQIRRLRSLAQRFGLAAIQGDGARHAGRRCQTRSNGSRCPASRGTATASTTAAIQRRCRVRRRRRSTKTTRSISTRSAHRSPRTSWSIRTRRTRSVSTPSRRPRTNGSRSSRFLNAARGRTATPSTSATCRRASAKFRPVVSAIDDDSYGVVDNVDDKLLVQTNRKAPNWRVVLVDPAHPEETNWKDVLPEKPEPLDAVTTAGGKLFATYLKDVMTRAYVYRLDGTLENEVALPGPGSAGGFGGPHDDAIRVLHLQLAERAPLDLSLRHRDATEHRVPSAEGSRLQRRCVRDDAGVLSEQGWHPRSNVPRPSQGAEARREQSHAPLRVRWLQRRGVADIQRRPPRAPRAGFCLRVSEYPWRRRIWREVARAGDEAQEAKRLRRLHRRGRVAHRKEVHLVCTGWRFRADRTAVCWLAP